MYGNKDPKDPWDDAWGARFIANELRRCCFVGLHMTWPMPGEQVGTDQTHVLTVWGDDLDGPDPVSVNPARLMVTDSDRDTAGDVQTYTYDPFDDPNHTEEEGPGWYFNWSEPVHPYIMYIVTLDQKPEEPQSPVYCDGDVRVTESYQIEQDEAQDATGLHYQVGTDVNICRYATTIDWDDPPSPTIIEDAQPPRNLTVDWDLTSAPVPEGAKVTITTDFWLQQWNGIGYDDVHFTYPSGLRDVGADKPAFSWHIDTPDLADPAYVPGMTGGYVVGAFELYADAGGQQVVSESRFQHEYKYNEDPVHHTFTLSAISGTLYVGRLRFGHSYGHLDTAALWAFDAWRAPEYAGPFVVDSSYIVEIERPDLLPYPCWERLQCRGDMNCDDYCNFGDINPFVMALVSRLTYEGRYPTCHWHNGDIDYNGTVNFDDINPFVTRLVAGQCP